MQRNEFNKNELKLATWQYMIRHTNVTAFCNSKFVFLKGNTETIFVIVGVCETTNKVNVCTKDDLLTQNNIISLPPECLIQREFLGLMVGKSNLIGDVQISLN